MVDEMDRIIDSVQAEPDESIFTSRRGLKLRLRKVNGRVFADAQKKLIPPEVPTTWIEEKGRDEENPNHPDYLRKLSDYNYQQQVIAFNVCFIMGVEQIIEVPEDIYPMESEEWVQQIHDAYEASDVEPLDIPDSGNRRKLAWLKYYALEDEGEQVEVLNRILSLGGGVLAREIEAAMDSFRSSDERLADNGIHIVAKDGSTDSLNDDVSKSGTRVRSPRGNAVRKPK